MKTNIKILLSVILVCALKQVSAANAIEAISKQLLTAGDKAVQRTMREVVEEATSLQQSANDEVVNLGHNKAERLQHQRRETCYHEMMAQKNTIKASLALAQDTYVQAERLRRKTVAAIEKMIERADKEALKIRTDKRRKIMAAFLAESQHNERIAWKTGLQNEYFEQLQALEEIVRQGEAEEEYQDFAENFAVQRKWFEAKLEEIKSPADRGYFLLFNKVQALRNIMISFERVAQMLDERIKHANIDVQDIDKARVLALYDIQALVSDKKKPTDVVDEGYLSKRECLLVVDGLFNKLAARHRIDSLMAQKNTMKYELITQQKRQLLLDELAAREQQELSSVVDNARNSAVVPVAVADASSVPQDTVVAAVEKVNRENADLQITVLEKQNTIARLGAVPADVAEQQARAALENELQQRMARG